MLSVKEFDDRQKAVWIGERFHDARRAEFKTWSLTRLGNGTFRQEYISDTGNSLPEWSEEVDAERLSEIEDEFFGYSVIRFLLEVEEPTGIPKVSWLDLFSEAVLRSFR